MSWWNAKYKNDYGEYEITFASKEYEKTRAIEKVCCAVMDKVVKSPLDVEVVVRCRECKYRGTDDCIFHIKGEPADEELLLKLDNDFCSYGERKGGSDNEP